LHQGKVGQTRTRVRRVTGEIEILGRNMQFRRFSVLEEKTGRKRGGEDFKTCFASQAPVRTGRQQSRKNGRQRDMSTERKGKGGLLFRWNVGRESGGDRGGLRLFGRERL